jgi:raffinose/stachyose/melibiose transport system permease protein
MWESKYKRPVSSVVVGWLIAAIVMVPLYIMVVSAFKSVKEIFTNPLALPSSWDLNNFAEAIEKTNFFHALFNSVLITFASVALIVIVSSMAAWSLARDDSKISKMIFLLFAATMIIPFQSLMIPLVQYFNNMAVEPIGFHMLDSYYGVILAHTGFGLSLSVVMYHGFIKGIPRELEEAAAVDGCGQWRIFWSVVFPNLKPVTATVAVLNALSIWNDYLLPALLLRSPEYRTLPMSTFYFMGSWSVSWNTAMAFLTLALIPVIIFYMLAQKKIIAGVMGGAIK